MPPRRPTTATRRAPRAQVLEPRAAAPLALRNGDAPGERLGVRKTYKLFIGGEFPRTESGRSYLVHAADGSLLANACRGTRKDIRDAVRAAVQSPSPTAAETAAEAAVARARVQTGESLQLTLEGQFARASVLRARVRTEVDLARIPLFGAIGTVVVSGDAAAPVDRYRSLLGSQSP